MTENVLLAALIGTVGSAPPTTKEQTNEPS